MAMERTLQNDIQRILTLRILALAALGPLDENSATKGALWLTATDLYMIALGFLS